MLGYIGSFFSALNTNSHPGDIAHGFCLGLLLALMPKLNLLWTFLFFFILFIRINRGTFFLSLIFLSFLAPYCDSIIDQLGYMVLSLPMLQGFYNYIADIPFVGWTYFYNTMVTGSLALGLILYIPCYGIIRVLIYFYRKTIQQKLKSAIMNSFLAKLPLVKSIKKISSLKDAVDL